MKTISTNKNFKKILTYLMSFAMVIFTYTANAQCTMIASGTSIDESCAAACDGSVSVNVSSSACVSTDTVMAGAHASIYNYAFTRGYWFQAQSSYTVSGFMCAEESNPAATNQSVAFVDYGTTAPLTGTPFTNLFSAIKYRVSLSIACGVVIL